MKPFVAIGGVLDYLFAKYFGSVSVEKCAKTENLYSAQEAVSGPGMGIRAFYFYSSLRARMKVMAASFDW